MERRTKDEPDVRHRKEASVRIAILGWGSLLWDTQSAFDDQHEDEWCCDGPSLKIEYSRVSQTRKSALTLVLDTKNGKACRVAYTLSKRQNPNDAINDVRCREGTTLNNIGFYFADNTRQQAREKQTLENIRKWASEKNIDVVIWTDLKSNFQEKSICRKPFSIEAALCHIRALDTEGMAMAKNYVLLSPSFVNTPLREALQAQLWPQESRESPVC